MIINGWLESAKKIKSPHFDQRRPHDIISLLVIHNISLPPAKFEENYVEDFFLGKLDPSIDPYFKQIADLRVSSHLYIRRNGDVIQFVSFNHRAWHAGQSQFAERTNCNDFSIGIELEGTDNLPYTNLQYQKLIDVTQQLRSNYPLITPSNIKGHNEIAPGRKTDPGESFDWKRFLDSI